MSAAGVFHHGQGRYGTVQAHRDFKRKELEVMHTRVDVGMSPTTEDMAAHILQLHHVSLSRHLI